MNRTLLQPPSFIYNDQPITPDSDELASDLDERNADTQSLSASITDYPEYFGRRYHRYREGSYPFPNDDPELERHDHLHSIFNSYFDGELFFAPVDPETCHSVLDIGTGTGIWPIEVAESKRLPHAHITGIDLSPTQPEMVPENVTFEIQDFTDSDWCRPTGEIDLIHSRFLSGSLPSPRSLIRMCRLHLKPGDGWLEMHEMDPTPQCDDNTMPKNWRFTEWAEMLNKASRERLNPPRSIAVAQDLQQYMKDSGLVDVSQLVFKVPLGPWPKDKKLKVAGGQMCENIISGLPAFSYKLMGAEGLQMDREEIELCLLDVRKSLGMREVHSYMRYFVVFGRRPSAQEEAELRARRRRGEED